VVHNLGVPSSLFSFAPPHPPTHPPERFSVPAVLQSTHFVAGAVGHLLRVCHRQAWSAQPRPGTAPPILRSLCFIVVFFFIIIMLSCCDGPFPPDTTAACRWPRRC
jgi:hypothetical protein